MADQILANEVAHPVVGLLDQQRESLSDLSEGLAHVEHSSALEAEYISREFAPLADDLVGLGDFTLEPADLHSIWGRVLETFPNRHLRYSIAAALSGAYAVQAVEAPLWKTVPRALHEDFRNGFPEALAHDTEGLTIVRSRILAVSKSVGIIHSHERSKVSSELYENFGNGLGALAVRMESIAGEW